MSAVYKQDNQEKTLLYGGMRASIQNIKQN